jgi:hypothetical protein
MMSPSRSYDSVYLSHYYECMKIDPTVEAATRKMLGHAVRHELDKLAAMVLDVGNEVFSGSIQLCLLASSYIAIDVNQQWPADADLREIAKTVWESEERLDISKQRIYEYLSRVAFGAEKAEDVFSAEGIVTIPVYATASLLVTFCPRDKHWWEYLDQIWDAVESADRTPVSVLPALMLRARREPAREPAA